jgi:hypothetical protein
MIAVHSNNAEAKGIQWPDYLTPLHNIRVLYEDEQEIFVDLPEEFLKGENVIISITLLSQLYVVETGIRRPSFKIIKPSLRFNKNTRADYTLPVEDFPGVQAFQVKIKTSHLHAGQNLVKVVFEWQGGGECFGEGCSFLVLDMCFKESGSSDDPKESGLKPPSDVPKESTKVVESNFGFYELWYDPKKWTSLAVEDAQKKEIDIRLVNNDEGSYISSIAYQGRVSSPSATAFVEKTLSNIIPDGQIVSKQEISTKNQQVHIIKREGDIQGSDYVSYGFYWAGPSDFFAFFTRTQKEFSEEFEKDLKILINGLVFKADI